MRLSKLTPLQFRIFRLFVGMIFFLGIVFWVAAATYLFLFWRYTLREKAQYYAGQIAYQIRGEIDSYIQQGKGILSLLEWGVLSSPDQIQSVLIDLNLRRKEVECIWIENGKSKVSSCFKQELPSARCATFPCFISLLRDGEPELLIGTKDMNGNNLWIEVPIYLFLAKMRDVIEGLSTSFCVRIRDVDGAILWDSFFRNRKCYLDEAGKNILSSISLPELGWVVQVGYRWMWKDFFRFVLPLGGEICLVFLFLIMCFVVEAWCVSKNLFKDLQKIVPFVREIEKGNFSVYLDIHRQDEIGMLARSVNRMVEELDRYQCASNIGAVGKAVAWISHELKNKLLPVKAFIDSICERVNDRDFIYRMQRLCQIQLNECEQFLQELNALQGDISISRKKEDLCLVLREAIDTVTPLLFKSKIKVELVCQDKLFAYIDERLFRIAIVNLLLNAIEVLGEKGRIRVIAYRESKRLIITVEDNGPGIPDSLKDCIFEPFFTLNFSEIPVKRGIGLAIVFSIIQAHEGKISVESEEGKGTRFVIFLPD